MNIIQVSENQCLGWILMHPELAQRSFSMDNPRFESTKSTYISIVGDKDIFGMVKFECFAERIMQIHCYMNPEYWGSKKLFECYDLLQKYFRDMGAESLLTMCPEDAQPAIKASKKVGFEEVGRLKKAVNWKGRINDMILLQKVIA